MVTVTSLYICISYIYTYSYNFYYLSSLHSYCMSIFSFIYSMSLAYLLSILLLYSCFYTLHIPYSFYNLLFYVFGISPIYTFTVFLFLYFFIFHIHSINYCFSCSISYSYFSCVHLSCYSLLLFMLYYILIRATVG